MEKQQQILQMAKDICRVKLNCNDVCNPISACDALKYAERAVEAGYSKQSEGEWKFEWDPIKDPKKYFIRIVCSCCGLKTGQVSNFCPQCGAKMKGGAE